ncbi:hypothetical protein TNCV_4822601 [Trichonephila clavipes]|nr:hypothetical protein TNCV_4822601 [Trichonephila clavipes]
MTGNKSVSNRTVPFTCPCLDFNVLLTLNEISSKRLNIEEYSVGPQLTMELLTILLFDISPDALYKGCLKAKAKWTRALATLRASSRS